MKQKNILHTLFSIYGATLWLHSRDFDIQDFFDVRVAPIFLKAQANAGATETMPICAGCKEPTAQWIKYQELAIHDRLACKAAVNKMYDECSELTIEIMQAVLDEAVEYYALLDEGNGADPERKAELHDRLTELSAPWSENVAYHAFLEMRRLAALGEEQDE